MLSDVLVTMGGNVVEDPAPRMTSGGAMWTRLRLAATPRRFDRAAEEWVDGETVWLDAVCWRRLAEHVVDSLHKGDRVLVHGRLRRRSFEVEGQKRHVFEIDAESVAPDLARARATVQRTSRLPSTPVPPPTSEPAGDLVPEGTDEAVQPDATQPEAVQATAA